MTEVVTLPMRHRLRVVHERAPGVAEVIDLPRRTVGEMAAEAIAQIERQSKAAEAGREAVRAVELMRHQLDLIVNQCIQLARMYDAQGAANTGQLMIGIAEGARDKMVSALR